ncbi:hypothetical protein ASD45_08610 [Pseudolabrys sp. Root1462]|uniref:hypothetical protein n=1 Tax=Pseudolabrys sp. Root1462 TaxID=1736466 RepID=UPI0007035B04|nr:hypothetical protein [Pseudolabrys sp. Root1462]KQZ00915.1 hypothetical protein ASD45_08610 [Pseudolabrys sp. Root1462]
MAAETKVLRLRADWSFLREIIDRRCHLNKIGKRTRPLDEALEREVEIFKDHFHDLKGDGEILIEYVPSRELMSALAEVELQ